MQKELFRTMFLQKGWSPLLRSVFVALTALSLNTLPYNECYYSFYLLTIFFFFYLEGGSLKFFFSLTNSISSLLYKCDFLVVQRLNLRVTPLNQLCDISCLHLLSVFTCVLFFILVFFRVK